MKSLDEYGSFANIRDKVMLLGALCSIILAILSVIMSKTQPITRLRTLCDILFARAIFGVAVTAKVMKELYQKYFFKQQCDLFAPWKVLSAIDTSVVGGLNYIGLEPLPSCEDLDGYQRGILQLRSCVQKASYKLHEVGQCTILFHKKPSNMGEMYQFDFEFFVHYILKTFNLYEIAQRELVEHFLTLDGAKLCDQLSNWWCQGNR